MKKKNYEYKVEVVPYDSEWEIKYLQEAVNIWKILADRFVAIHHIGSTSVPHLLAKPIIDIMPIVKNINQVDELNASFEELGYECMGECGIPGRRYFHKAGDNHTHHIHIFEERNAPAILRHLAVRDYLRAHPQTATEYGKLKQELALRFPTDIEAYCNGKDAFMKKLESLSLKWIKTRDE